MSITVDENTITFINTNNIISDDNGILFSKGLDFIKTMFSTITINSGVLTIDLSIGQHFHVIANENITSIIFTNFSSYKSGRVVIKNNSNLTHNISFPSNIVWQHNSVPSLSGTNGSYIILEFKTSDSDILLHYTLASTNFVNYLVTVASGTNSYGSGNKFFIDGSVNPIISLLEGNTYTFDQSHSSNTNHPIRLSTSPNGIHSGGSDYTTGVSVSGTPGTNGVTTITVTATTPTLYYYCANHSGMGN